MANVVHTVRIWKYLHQVSLKTKYMTTKYFKSLWMQENQRAYTEKPQREDNLNFDNYII